MLCEYSMLVTLYKLCEIHYRLLGTNAYHVKAKIRNISCCGLALSSQPQIKNFTSSKIAPKKRTARLFCLIQPIKSLVFYVDVVNSSPYFRSLIAFWFVPTQKSQAPAMLLACRHANAMGMDDKTAFLCILISIISMPLH